MRFYEHFKGFLTLRIMGKCTSRHLFQHGELVHASACVHRDMKHAGSLESTKNA